MRLKSLIIAAMLMLSMLPLKAQLRSQHTEETAYLNIVQFPSSQEHYSTLVVEVTQKALAGDAGNRIAGSRLGRFIEDETGTISDKTTSRRNLRLIPQVFISQDTLFLEVLFYDEEYAQNFDLENRFYDGTNTGVKAEYNLYKMPGMVHIYSEGPYWIQGKGSGQGGAFQTSQQINADRSQIAQGWAIRQVKNKYALERKTLSLPVYMVRNLDGEHEAMAEQAQENFRGLTRRFREEYNSAEFKASVNDCISAWEQLLQQYVAGTTRRNQAAINDNNVWTLYYNLAFANFLTGDISKANSWVDKGIEITKTEWKETTNNKGEVIGRTSVGSKPGSEVDFHNLKEQMTAFWAGLSSQNKDFVEILTNNSKISEVSRTVRNLATNLFLSEAMQLDVPVEFVSNDFNGENPSSYSGSVSMNGNKLVEFSVAKHWMYFANKRYIAKINRIDNSSATKQKINSAFSPYSIEYDFIYQTRDSFYGLPGVINFDKVKTLPKANAESKSLIQYDWNGDIIIKNYMIRDKSMFLRWVKVTEEDALGISSSEFRVKHNDLAIKSIDINRRLIERDRPAGFFEAMFMSTRPLLTTETTNETTQKQLVFTENKLNLNDGTDSVKKEISITEDSNGNWTNMTIGDIIINRNIEF